MDQDDDHDDVELNRPLDLPYVIVGLALMVACLLGMALAENRSIYVISGVGLLLSLFVMTKRKRQR